MQPKMNARWGKSIQFTIRIFILLSIILYQPGFQVTVAKAETQAADIPLTSNDGLLVSSASNELPAEEASTANAEVASADNSEGNPYGATLTCTGEVCSDTNPGIYLNETMKLTKYWAPTDWGTPEYFNFHIDCEESSPGCTQHTIYYKTTLKYKWSSPYTRSPTQFIVLQAILSTALDTYATGKIDPVYCGIPGSSKGSCTIVTSGVLDAGKLNPSDSIDNHFYIRRHVGGFGIYDTEEVDWTVEVSFDPSMIDGFLQDDATCILCPGSNNSQYDSMAAPINYIGDPVNTRTGAFTYPVKDITIQTSAGELAFERTYLSTRNLKYEFPLGYGWFDNLSPRLIFPSDPDGRPGMVRYKSPSGNIYQYWDTGVDTYVPYSGVKEILTKYTTDTVVTYTITEPDQTVYLFDSTGKVTSRTTSKGDSWDYIYDADGYLDKVEADGGLHYLDFSYTTQGQLISIADHANRSVTFNRDTAGDLVTVTDVLGQDWTYDYDESHLLIEVIDPDLNTVVRNEYGTTTEYHPHQLDFNNYSVGIYSNDYGNHTRVVEDDGRTFHITGHASLTIPFSYTLTNNTVIEFDYKSTSQGRVQGIGFDDNWYNINENWRCMQLWGTVAFGNTNYKNYGTYTPEWQHYVIPIGTYYTGQQNNMVFYNDDHDSPYDTESIFRDVQVYESTGLKPITFASNTLTDVTSQTGTYTMAIEDNGSTLHLTGNVWKTMPVNYNVTPNTVIELNFKSTAEGEVHGIGLDTDKGLDEIRTFKLYGTQSYGKEMYNNYSAFAPEWKHYIIPVGQYYTGPHMNLYFGNDHDDVTPPTAESYFSNVTIYENNQKFMKQYDGEDNLVVALTFNEDGTTNIQDALGNISTDTYNGAGVLSNSHDALNHDTIKSYDANYKLTSITDPAGHTTGLTWNDDGVNLLSTIDALNQSTSLTYDSFNNLTSVTNALTHETTYSYNGTLLTGVTDALENTTSYTYNTDGLIETITDPLDRMTSFTYNDDGQRTSMTDPGLNTWLYTYDDLGWLIDTTDPLERVNHNEYDATGNLVRVTRNYDPAKLQNEDNLWNIVTEYTYDARGRQISVTDTYNQATVYTYDDADRLLTTTDPDGNVTTNAYNAGGQLVLTIDSLNHTTAYEYDALGRVITVTDELGNHTHTGYDPDGTVATTTDALDKVTGYTYDELGRTIMVTDALGNHTHTTYDALGNVETTTDARGNVTTYTYDALGRLTYTADPLSGVTQTVYDDAGQQSQMIDARGNSTFYTYDDAGRLLTVTDDLGNVTAYEYDALGRKTAMVDARGSRTSYIYDALDRVVSVTDPFGHNSTTSYDALGRVRSRTDANGSVTSFTYDILGRTATQTDAEGGVTSYTYDDLGRRLTVTDPNGHTTATEYDALGRAVAVTDPNGYVTTTAYNPAGNVISLNDALSHTTTYTYDDLGRQVAVIDPDNHSTETVYDEDGNRIQLVDPTDTITKYEFDALGRLTAVVEDYRPGFNPTVDINVRTEYTYDANGNRLTILDANGHATGFTYDDLNRLVVERDALDHTWSTTYDEAGNRASTTDAKNVTVNYTYDLAGRLTLINFPDPQIDTSFTYDDGGRRLSMTDSQGTTTWTYNDANRILSITDPFDQTVSYGYDDAGNKTSLTYPDLQVVNYGYSAANELMSVSSSTVGSVNYSYNAVGQLLSVIRPNGINTTYNYLDNDWLQGITHASSTDTLASYQYQYNAAGNRIRAEEFMAGNSGTGVPTVVITVVDSAGIPLTGKTVYAFNGSTYSNYSQVTDMNGQASITLPESDYRFRVDVDGTQFWSGASDHCTVGVCGSVLITVPQPVLVSVQDSDGNPRMGLPVYAYDGTTYTNYQGTTGSDGQLSLRLPAGSYRFRADFNGTQFWSAAENNCDVPVCSMASVVVTLPVTVSVLDELEMPQAGIAVYAYDGAVYTNFSGTTGENGLVSFTLPIGAYRFRADFNGTQFWSDAANPCAVPGCAAATVTVTPSVMISVQDTDATLKAGLKVYVYNGSTYTNYNGTTNTDGQVAFTLPQGNYRFRADLNGTQFWSGAENGCTVPGCDAAVVVVTKPLTVSVLDTDGAPKAGLKVYVFNGSTYTNYNKTTDANGQAIFTLPLGSYRFRADLNGTQFWSDTVNHCTLPGCESTTLTVTRPVTVNVLDSNQTPQVGVKVYAFIGSTYTNYNKTTDANGHAIFTLPLGSYRFRADINGTQYWSASENHCSLPGCETVAVDVDLQATPTPTEEPTAEPTSEATPTQTGMMLDGITGKVLAAIKLETSAQSGSNPVLVTVLDTAGIPVSGLNTYAFDGSTYTGLSGTTNESGQVTFTFAEGTYRFRADRYGTRFWSGSEDHCSIPACADATITVTIPVTVSIDDTNGLPSAGLNVYAFSDSVYTGYHTVTDENGSAVFTLPEGSYRFRADLNGTQFWSGSSDLCTLPGCTEAAVTVTVPLVVTVANHAGMPFEGLNVYVFDGTIYTGYNGKTDASGQVVFTLPEGSFRFRADYDGVPFWSDSENGCSLPGCTTAAVSIPGGNITETNITIDYTYDPLGRLTSADYSDGQDFSYTYDAAGNRLTQVIGSTTTTYSYDNANRMISVDGLTYTWDDNGNLINDGVNTYEYDIENRLTKITNAGGTSLYAYNGLGDRLFQVVDIVTTHYTLDLNAGLTQVLTDGTNTYLYGLSRLGQMTTTITEYFLGDALGSVRQLTDLSGDITLSKSYTPFGEVIASTGTGESVYGYTGEVTGPSGLVYLRARYYSASTGHFITKDIWQGNFDRSLSLNKWLYALGNPINLIDPSGLQSENTPYVCNWPSNINWYCNILNNPETNPEVLRTFYTGVSILGRTDKNRRYASDNLVHFLENKGTTVKMEKGFIEDVLLTDGNEIKAIENNLKQYFNNGIQPLATLIPDCSTTIKRFSSSGSISIRGVSTDALFYAWNAHNIKINYKGSLFSDNLGGYKIIIQSDFHAYDTYDWHGIGDGNLTATFDAPFGTITVPDEWAARVQEAGLGMQFDMYADWSELAIYTINNGITWSSAKKITELRWFP